MLPAQRRALLGTIGRMAFAPYDCQWVPHLVGPKGAGKSCFADVVHGVVFLSGMPTVTNETFGCTRCFQTEAIPQRGERLRAPLAVLEQAEAEARGR